MRAEGIKVFLALLAGIFLGASYFGALWWTVRQLPAVRRPRSWLVGSFLLRMALALVVFYLILQWGVLALGAAMGGFLLARLAWLGMSLKYSLKQEPSDNDQDLPEAGHGNQP
jgi:F1F0 ATPase subunit 2